MLLKMGQRTADGLDGQSEIVRDIVAGDWQDHAIIGATGQARSNFDEKGADFLICCDSSDNEQL